MSRPLNCLHEIFKHENSPYDNKSKFFNICVIFNPLYSNDYMYVKSKEWDKSTNSIAFLLSASSTNQTQKCLLQKN